MKKKLSVLLIVAMCISTFSSIAYATNVHSVTASVHKNYNTSQGSLLAEDTNVTLSSSASVEISSDHISVIGEVATVPYNIAISGTRDDIVAVEANGNFEVISFVVFNNFARIVLTATQSKDIVYLDIADIPHTLESLTYNPNWYADFFVPISVTEEDAPATRGSGSNNIVYKAVYSIYEDVYTEKLTVGHNYQAPTSISKGNSDIFTTSVNIVDRTTTVALRTGGTQTIDSTSLYIRGCNVKVATAKGNYVSKLYYQHSAKKCTGSTTSVAVQAGFSLSIPGTPLTLSGSITTTRTYGSNGESGTIFYTEDNKGTKKLMLANVSFNPTYHASYEDPSGFPSNGDQFTAEWTISTDPGTVVLSRNALNVNYAYTLESTGNISGTGTPTILSEDKSFNQTIHYTVK